MTLSEYLQAKELTYAAFGERIGVAPQTVHRYAKYGRIPESAVMARISKATGGLVVPNDFFGIVAPRKARRAA